MKQTFCLARATLLLLVMLCSIGAWADDSGSCGTSLTYSYKESTHTLTISGTGDMADYPDADDQPWKNYRTSISTVVIENGVTSIGQSAFYDCRLTSITIPASVTSIGASAFYGCKLTSITLNEGLTTINEDAFSSNGTTIESVSIPQSVTSIGNNAFNGTSVRNFYINNIPSKIAIGETTPFKQTGVTIHVFTQMKSIFENATNWSIYKGHFVDDIEITHVESVTLDNESMIVKTNASGKLNATINPADARVKDVVFTSSNDNLVQITNAATGEFEAGSQEGNATITCTAMDGSGAYATCNVEVKNYLTPAESVTLNKTTNSLDVGGQFKLTATIAPTDATFKNVSWRSSDEDVAIVDNNGYVTAIAPGVATITAISGDGQARANCVVSVIGSCGTGVTWVLTGTSPNYTLTISGTGDMADYPDADDQPWKNYRTSISTVVIENGVTSIGNNAFNGCTNLTSVALNGPATIGSDAFPTNANTTVTIANGLYLYNGDVVLSGNITDMNKLNGKTLRVAIQYIKNGTTEYCTNYTVLDNTMTTISEGWYVVKSDVEFNGNLSTNANGEVHIILCDGATLTANNIEFGRSNYLYIYGQSQGTGTANISGRIEASSSLQIYGGTINVTGNIMCPQSGVGIYGGNVTAEGINSFRGLNFTGGTITAGTLQVTEEGNITLGGATVKANSYNVTQGNVTILTGITYYDGTGARYPAGNLTSDQISAIRGKTLRTYDCGTCGKDDPATGDVDESQNVTWMLTGNTLTISGTGAMADYAEASGQPWTAMHSDIKAIVIEDGVTSIGNYAFSLCENVTSGVSIPASVTSIGSSAFDGCSNLTTVTLNSNPFIGESAFYSSTAVTMNLTANGPVGGAYWTTFYNKNYSFQTDANTQVFKAALSGTTLTLTELTTDKIVNKDNAVILKSTASPIVMTLTTTDSSNDFNGNSLQGVDDPAGLTAADPSTTYVLNNGSNGVGFYKLTAGKTLGVGKAYLTYSGTTAPGFFGLDVDNENTTEVGLIDNSQLTIDNWAGAIYDLQGRKIANGQKPTQKGLYIVNGKKIMIK